MIPHIPDQRKNKATPNKPFGNLVAYITTEKKIIYVEKDKEGNIAFILRNENGEPIFEKKPEDLKEPALINLEPLEFSDIINYTTSPKDALTSEDKCIGIKTHGVADIASAEIEMNAIASQNRRCKSPAYHFILSWPDHEHPTPDSIYDAAEHALKALGLASHQYVLAIHANTDNIHCHVAVNRINPETFRSKNIEWAQKTLHMAARESEIEHGWTHDNGIYIVKVDELNKKQIVLNPDIGGANVQPYAHRDKQSAIAVWHDRDDLDLWIKKEVARDLKRALPALDGWPALHAWLGKKNISLSDSGGGGMRIQATSVETGEQIDMPASKAFRFLKRPELEQKWGAFALINPIECSTPNLSHLTAQQIQKGVESVLRTSFDKGIPPDHILRAVNAQRNAAGTLSQASGGLHELPAGRMDGNTQGADLLLPHTVSNNLGNISTRNDTDMRRTGTSEIGSRSQRSLNRDDSKRDERKAEREAARLDLKQRFAVYKRYVRSGDDGYLERSKEIRLERSRALTLLREEVKAAKADLARTRTFADPIRLETEHLIMFANAKRKLQIEAASQEKRINLQKMRLPPLGWREWLYEQSNLGDKAAVAALRGIVYQARRDAKYRSDKESKEIAEDLVGESEEEREKQYRKLMARLLDEEKKEIAIRSASIHDMRPYEASVLLTRYQGMQYHVTGNGCVQYSDEDNNKHLFTDRGNRVTFDRAQVEDEEIRMALIHAQQKFGNKLTLTGTDSDFSNRMACIADEMGIIILNPELQPVIIAQRQERKQQAVEAITIIPTEIQEGPILQQKNVAEEAPVYQSLDRLKAKVFAIDPRAEFVIPDITDNNRLYSGHVAAIELGNSTETNETMFAQHIGRSVYVLHTTIVPESADEIIDVIYKNGTADIKMRTQDKDKDKGLQ